ncbi:MAG: histidine kinase [Eubacteriales bacterium]|nr:histidine kinase [Eubacteriales bacterium]
MKIRNKILLVVLVVLLSNGILINLAWYTSSSRMTDKYLTDISRSAMKDAYQAFEYLLVDTSYMAAMISLNDKNIIRPVQNLRERQISTENGQWNQEYLNNQRVISDYITSMNGYKYYIVGITVVVDANCVFSTSHLMQNHEEIYQHILELDQEQLKTKMIMMDPIHVEGGKSTLSSDYVVPAVRAVLDKKRQPVGYVVLYFDYGVIENMFASNLPEGSHFQVINENQSIIFSNCGDEVLNAEKPEKGFVYNTFEADTVEWKFTMALPSRYYIKDINQTVYTTIIMMALVLLGAAVLVVIVVSRMTAEISNLRNTMHMVSDGNLDVSYQVKSRDEIGQMGQTFNHMVVHIRKLMSRVAEEEEQKRMVEMAFLEAQINPHFISNILNNVIWMAKIQHADNIVPLVQSLNSMLQNVMHQEHDLIPLRDELAYLDNYLRIVEYSGSYDFILEKECGQDTEDLLILRFILQPILENAIYHGLPQSLEKEGKIKISAQVENEKLILAVEDNGDGMTKEQIAEVLEKQVKDRKHFNGIGVPNVKERIQLFFGKEYGLSYESEIGRYTRAVFTLPVIHPGEHLGEQYALTEKEGGKNDVKDQTGSGR